MNPSSAPPVPEPLSAAPCGQKGPVDHYPLTPVQQGMFATWLRDPGAGVDVGQMVCTLPEAVDSQRLRAAWEALTRAHPILRTTFTADQQTVHAAMEFPWNESLPVDLEPFLEVDRHICFDLEKGPLQRLTLIRQGPADFRLVWTFHHILLDGRSITLLLRDVFRAYDYDVTPGSGEPPGGTFADYARWQAGVDHSVSDDFWKEHLKGLAGPVPLVVDRRTLEPGREEPVSGKGEGFCPSRLESTLEVPVGVANSLRAFAAVHGLTLQTLVQGAFALLTGRYAGTATVVFGATRACRHSPVPQTETMAGLLINTVPVKVDLPPDLGLLVYLKKIRKHWLDLRQHERTPLSRIRQLAPPPPGGPVFNHLLVFEHEDYTTILRATGGPTFPQRAFHLHELPDIPLTLSVTGSPALRLQCSWQARLFDPGTIDRFLGQMGWLLQQFAETSPDTPLGAFKILTPEEHQFLVHDIQPAVEGPPGGETLTTWFAGTCRRFPERTAVTSGEDSLTYRELDELSDAIARAMESSGVQQGDFSGLCLDRNAGLVAGILGILKTGAAWLPMDPTLPPARLQKMSGDAKTTHILTSKKFSELLSGTKAKLVFLEDIQAGADGDASNASNASNVGLSGRRPGITPDSPAYLIYTSGTSGQPKGCLISHRNVVRLMTVTRRCFDFDEKDVWTLFHSTAFDFSVWEIWGALLHGGRLVVVPWPTTRNPCDFLHLLRREKVTVLNQTPSAFRQLDVAEAAATAAGVGNGNASRLALRYVIFGGEALHPAVLLADWFGRHGDDSPQIVNMYGITETTVHATFRRIRAADLDKGSLIGRPLADFQLYLLEPQSRQPVPIGVPGEIYLSGPGLAAGYLNRDLLTAERFPSNHLTGSGRLYKTGDLARYLPCSAGGLPELEYLGRIDEQIKIRGFRIEPEEIRARLISHPAIMEAMVAVHDGYSPGPARLCAWLLPEPDQHLPGPEPLRDFLKSSLPDYMIPSVFIPVSHFPLNPNGKLDRKALPPPTAGIRPERQWTAASTPAEMAMVTIWEKVLRVESISVTDNFFEAGGDSILALHVVSGARSAGWMLTPRQLHDFPVLRDLAAAAVASSAGADAGSSLPDLAAPFPLTPVQQWFFSWQVPEGIHHYNQSFLLVLQRTVDPEAMESALHRLVAHHPALRMRFRYDTGSGKWIPRIGATETARLLTVFCGLENQQIPEACAGLQTTLDIENGPLLRAALFQPADGSAETSAQLCLTVHHLAVDGVSWHLILRDLECFLTGAPPAPATATWPRWASQSAQWAATPEAAAELPYWQETLRRFRPLTPIQNRGSRSRMRDAFSHTTRLPADATRQLLQEAGRASGARINDLLLTALALAHRGGILPESTGDHHFSLVLEGHGRNEKLAPGLPTDRTAGWFTSLFPVALTLPSADPAAAINAIREQLAAIPGQGAGYPLLAGAHGLPLSPPGEILFNYMGQMDAATDGLALFSLSREEPLPGPWSHPDTPRPWPVEVNAMVLHGRLTATFSSAPPWHTPDSLAALSTAFLTNLQELLRHCLALPAANSSPPDYPMAGLTGDQLHTLLALTGPAVTIARLSAGQQLLYQAALSKPNAGWDQWHGQLHGPVDPDAFEAAWKAVVARHAVLRSTFHNAGLPHPVMVVHPEAAPVFVRLDAAGPEDIPQLLARDAARINDPARMPVSRITLLRFSRQDHYFLWSVPALHLDGGSAKLVFHEFSTILASLTESGKFPALPPTVCYSGLLEWIAKQDPAAAEACWKQELNGITSPTPLPLDRAVQANALRGTTEIRIKLPEPLTARLTQTARSHGVPPNTAAQAAWAVLLAHTSGQTDIIHGTVCAGRPETMEGSAAIVGPCANQIPVRVRIQPGQSVSSLLRQLHLTLTDSAAGQYLPLSRIQDQSAIPWRHRLFESLLVFQNHSPGTAGAITEPAPSARLTGFSRLTGPIHSAYPLTLVITPGTSWDLQLIYQETAFSPGRARDLLNGYIQLIERFSVLPESPVLPLPNDFLLPCGVPQTSAQAPSRANPGHGPRKPLEHQLAMIWQRAFGTEPFGVQDNFFDLGGHSLLLLRVHQAICQELAPGLPLTTLFQNPTIATLAAHLHPKTSCPATADTDSAASISPTVQSRAAAARAAADRARTRAPATLPEPLKTVN